MRVWVLLFPLLLAFLPAVVLTSSVPPRVRAWACRVAFIVTALLIAAPWIWLRLGHEVPARVAMILITGSFAGGIVLSGATAGIVEDNAPPSPAIQHAVLRYHTACTMRPDPRGKRVLDVTGALVGLALTLPLWPIIGLLIWFEEPGPIFFTKNSVGRGGRTFRQFKFRSMQYGAERLTGPVVSPAGDPRTLRVGRRLRRWHLDELPELINVLSGSMSLVGPRPLRTVLVRKHLEQVPGYAERHTTRPGIACIAQIEKFHMPPQERLVKDLAYIERQSVRLDLELLVLAVLTTVRGQRHYDEPVLAAPAPPAVPTSRTDGQLPRPVEHASQAQDT
ncbi:sugar transferase [Dactylosporangium sp. NPDC051485]|uniref:sugar transferase n=1 Tax=Dactylosporangium sp. NPDC051485 TaxID=3154846 RepID=UPI0034458C86